MNNIWYLIIPIVFDCCFLYIKGFNISFVEWVSFIFVNISFLFYIWCNYVDKMSDEKRISFFPASFIGIIYCIIEIIILFVICMTSLGQTKSIVSMQIIILVAFILIITFIISTNKHTIQSMKIENKGSSFVNNNVKTIANLLLDTKDDATKLQLSHLKDILKSSPVTLSETDLEGQITTLINQLDSKDNMLGMKIDDILNLVQKRNNLL